MATSELIDALERKLETCEAALTEFSAVDAQLREQKLNPRVSDMIRVNRDTINSIERSMDLMRERLRAARAIAAEEQAAAARVGASARERR